MDLNIRSQIKYFIFLIISMKSQRVEDQKVGQLQKANSRQSQRYRKKNIILESYNSQVYCYSTSAKQIEWFCMLKKEILIISLFQNTIQVCLGLKILNEESHENAMQEPKFYKQISLQKMRLLKKDKSTLWIMFKQSKKEESYWKIQFQTKEIAQRWHNLLWLYNFQFNKQSSPPNKLLRTIICQKKFRFEVNQELNHKSIIKEFKAKQVKVQQYMFQISKQECSFGICHSTIVNIIQRKQQKICFLTLLQSKGFHFLGFAHHISGKEPIFYYLWPIKQARFIHQYYQQNKIFMEIDRGIDLHQISIEFYNKNILEKWLFLMLFLRQFPDKKESIQNILKIFPHQTQPTHDIPQEREQWQREQWRREQQQILQRLQPNRLDDIEQDRPQIDQQKNQKDPIVKQVEQDNQSNTQKIQTEQQKSTLPATSKIRTANTLSERLGQSYYEQSIISQSTLRQQINENQYAQSRILNRLSQSLKRQQDLRIRCTILEQTILSLNQSEAANKQKIKDFLQNKEVQKKKLEEEIIKHTFYSGKLENLLNTALNQKFQFQYQCKNLNKKVIELDCKITELTDKIQNIKRIQGQMNQIKSQLLSKHNQDQAVQTKLQKQYTVLKEQSTKMEQKLKQNQGQLKQLQNKLQESKSKQETLRTLKQRYFAQKEENQSTLKYLRKKIRQLAQYIQKQIEANMSWSNVLQDLNEAKSLLLSLSIDQHNQSFYGRDKFNDLQNLLIQLNLKSISQSSLISMNESVRNMLSLFPDEVDQTENVEQRQIQNYSQLVEEGSQNQR